MEGRVCQIEWGAVEQNNGVAVSALSPLFTVLGHVCSKYVNAFTVELTRMACSANPNFYSCNNTNC
jgi:hypothetical protein